MRRELDRADRGDESGDLAAQLHAARTRLRAWHRYQRLALDHGEIASSQPLSPELQDVERKLRLARSRLVILGEWPARKKRGGGTREGGGGRARTSRTCSRTAKLL